MAIIKGDMVNGKGEVLDGDEIRLAYRISNSITTGGVSYVYDRTENGEAVYRKSATVISEPSQPRPAQAHVHDATPTVDTLPAGARLSPDFVGRMVHFDGAVYRMMQPPTKYQGQYILLPVEVRHD